MNTRFCGFIIKYKEGRGGEEGVEQEEEVLFGSV